MHKFVIDKSSHQCDDTYSCEHLERHAVECEMAFYIHNLLSLENMSVFELWSMGTVSEHQGLCCVEHSFITFSHMKIKVKLYFSKILIPLLILIELSTACVMFGSSLCSYLHDQILLMGSLLTLNILA